jgi:hypothetical protein
MIFKLDSERRLYENSTVGVLDPPLRNFGIELGLCPFHIGGFSLFLIQLSVKTIVFSIDIADKL